MATGTPTAAGESDSDRDGDNDGEAGGDGVVDDYRAADGCGDVGFDSESVCV